LKYFTEPIEGWRLNKINDRNTLSTKIINKSEVLLKYDGEVEIDISNLCSMIYEVSLFKDWVPFCGDSKDIKVVGPAAKVAWLKFDLPFISDREGYFYGQGIDRMNSHGSIIIYCEGITGNKAVEKRLNLNLTKSAKTVELDLKFLVVEIKLKGPGLYEVKAFGHLDIKMSFIPEFVLGFFSKKIGTFLMEKLIKHANNIKGSEWEKRIKANTDSFYPWLREKVAGWGKLTSGHFGPELPPRPNDQPETSSKPKQP
jgi:uncharacterized protein (DUF2164 family)